MKFIDMAKLEANWDSYGAAPIDPDCIARASELAQLLGPDKWTAVPVNDGSVQLEQHCDGFDIEILISKAPSHESEGKQP